MWKYVIDSGKLYSSDGTLAGTGYSGGNCGKNPEGVNNPAMTNIPDIGSISVGLYTIGSPFTDSIKGSLVMRLTPDPNNEMFQRSGFEMHGDTTEMNQSASEGCIIQNRVVTQAVANSTDNRLQVIATEIQMKSLNIKKSRNMK